MVNFKNLKLVVKQCYQTGQFRQKQNWKIERKWNNTENQWDDESIEMKDKAREDNFSQNNVGRHSYCGELGGMVISTATVA